MRIHPCKPLFAWDCLDDNPTLTDTRDFLESLPDAELLRGLREHRGHGRDDYPVAVCWGVLLLAILFRHASLQACLDELQRNDALALLIGIRDPVGIPKPWNLSRFLDVLGQEPHRTRLRDVFNDLVRRLGGAVPDFGVDLAGDSAHLHARRPSAPKPEASTDKPLSADAATDKPLSADAATDKPLSADAATDKPLSADAAESPPLTLPNDVNQPIVHPHDRVDAHGLPGPAGGRKEYRDADGKVTQVFDWYGYKLHLLVDVHHEVATAYQITSPRAGDGAVLPALVRQTQDNLPAGRTRTLAYDKAADSQDVHEMLHDADLRPLIQMRALWKEEPERLLPGHDGTSNVVYDEAGTLYCYDTVSEPPVKHRMAFIGHEAARGTLKYRCPAKHEGFACPMADICNAGKSYGKTVRVKQEIDLRRFPSIPRATQQFERRYRGRTAVERVIARLKIFWGADDGNVTMATRFFAHVGAVLIVHVALALRLAATPREEGTLGRTRLSPLGTRLQGPTPVSTSEW